MTIDGDRRFRFIVTGLERGEVLSVNDNSVGHDGVGIGISYSAAMNLTIQAKPHHSLTRSFAGVDLGAEAAPDETTVCKFRHLLERNKLGKKLLSSVNEHLKRNGIKISNGTIVDATIISAPSSTKNKDGERDPEMHQTA